MENNDSFLHGQCEHCENPFEFPAEGVGQTIDCPHCGAQTVLAALDEMPPPAPSNKPTASEILAHFTGTVPPTKVSFLYRVGLALVTFMMVLLPVIYFGIVCLTAYGVYWYATNFTGILDGGGRGFLIKLVIYIAPLFAGTILVLFMIKPLFARRPAHAQPMALNPAFQPTVFAFIARICDVVGAPMPKRIDLDCNLNASASFRRGLGSLFGNDLVLTIGLPLIAGMNMQQLAGVIAHEFGHFTQGFGMRLSYVIRSINFWFARVVYERDAWDVMLEEAAAEAEDWRIMIVINSARFGVWCSRQVLKILMLTGHVVSSFLLRQMEYDADSYQIKLVGSQAFEESFRRLHVLSHSLKPVYNEVRVGWNNGRELPNDLPALMLKHDNQLTAAKRTQLEDTMGLETSSLFDTHPSTGDRIRCARQKQDPGVFHLQAPATELFENFDILSKQITELHYSDDLGIPTEAAKFVPVRQKEEIIAPPVENPLVQNNKPAAGGGGLRISGR